MSNETLPIRTVAASRGADWLAEGFGLFRLAPLPWLGVAVTWLGTGLLLQSIGTVGWLGSLALNVALPALFGGLMVGCKAQTEKQPFRFEFLWAGFSSTQRRPLIMLGVICALLLVALTAAMFAIFGFSKITFDPANDGSISVDAAMSMLLALLILLILLLPVSLALWFAPALVALQGMEPVAALKASFRGCLANMPALFVNGLLIILIAIVATIPFALGWLVALPVLIASIYFGYRDIFVAT